ncbi:MAG: type II toxin-antitoxin system RelE/ParE family toxin [Candidatus Gracilibacteria bacterium]|jgi:mRNA-degrading endonuclease RelE of RelBE toxin-antitoxin system|nr:type II toxin-antitoxin system RelE/ParE family toxin [Candidatus Gracilibacteria bacterium]
MFEFHETPKYKKDMEKLDNQFQKIAINKLKQIKITENPLFLARKINGKKNKFRFRIGSLRIIFEIIENKIILQAIKHRKEIYKDLKNL